MLKKWEESEINYIYENFEHMNVKDISKYLNRSVKSIQVKASRLGIKKPKIETNLSYFKEIDSEEKAYWLGFIYADGYVSKTKHGYSFGLELGDIDIHHLEKLKSTLNSESNITRRTRTTGVKMCSFRVHRKEFVENLIKHGVTYRKTKIMELPNLKDELYRHFLRGYFDGDGHVTFRKRSTYGYEIRTGFVCGSEKFINQVLNKINDNLILKNGKCIRQEKENVFSYSTTNRNDALKLLDYLYKDAIVYLDRKYEKYLQIKDFTKDKVA